MVASIFQRSEFWILVLRAVYSLKKKTSGIVHYRKSFLETMMQKKLKLNTEQTIFIKPKIRESKRLFCVTSYTNHDACISSPVEKNINTAIRRSYSRWEIGCRVQGFFFFFFPQAMSDNSYTKWPVWLSNYIHLPRSKLRSCSPKVLILMLYFYNLQFDNLRQDTTWINFSFE